MVLEGGVTAQVAHALLQDPVEATPLGAQEAMEVMAMEIVDSPLEMRDALGVIALTVHADRGMEVPSSDKPQTKMLFGEGGGISLPADGTNYPLFICAIGCQTYK